MKASFDASFLKSLENIKDKKLADKLLKLITEVESAKKLLDVKSIKRLVGFKNFYRVRIGDYRVGLELVNSEEVLFIVVAHRKDIYKLFP
jgi:mRNA interferase RelE/StbE